VWLREPSIRKQRTVPMAPDSLPPTLRDRDTELLSIAFAVIRRRTSGSLEVPARHLQRGDANPFALPGLHLVIGNSSR
jgi:hypothetical protein